MKWCIQGARLIDPLQKLDEVSDLLIDNGKIRAVKNNMSVEDAPVVDLRGKVVVPGFLDMHVHLREPGREDKETIQSGTRAAAKGGFTGVACMPNTSPPMDTPSTVLYVLSKASKAWCRVFPIASVSKIQEGKELSEMARLQEAGAVAFSDDGKPVKTADLMRRALEYSKMLEMPIIDHCEEESLMDGSMHEGYYSTLLGLTGIPSQAETIAVMRDLALAELTGGTIHLAHLSTARSVELLREAKERGIKASGEVTIHHLLCNDQHLTGYDTNYKINPPLRTEADQKALIEGLKDGTIDCLVSDHAPHTREDKEVEFALAPSGISGVEILVPLALSELVKKEKVSLNRLVEALSSRPHKILKLKPPLLKEGEEATFTVLDLNAKETIDITQFESKGKNSPYHGKEVIGLPIMTVIAGKVVMENRKLIEKWNPQLPAFTAQ